MTEFQNRSAARQSVDVAIDTVRWAMMATACSLLTFLLAFTAEHTVMADEPHGAGLYVAVGYGGRRMASTDGIHWEHNTHWVEQGQPDALPECWTDEWPRRKARVE